MGTKNNPGRFDCYAKADPNEPIFILLARDPLAPALVRLWAHVRRVYDQANGQKISAANSDKYFEAQECADQMEFWQQKREVASLCICGHFRTQHNQLQDYQGPGLKAGPIEYRHCKVCNCKTYKVV